MTIIYEIARNLQDFVVRYDTWIYLVMFLIVFAKSGVCLLGFFPADVLMISAGFLVSQNTLNASISLVVFFCAAILGGYFNYFTGKHLGAAFMKLKIRDKILIKEQYIEKTKSFFEKYGAMTIVLGRFIVIIRSFAPFVAGVKNIMSVRKFSLYNLFGGILWVSFDFSLGYFFGSAILQFLK